MNIFQLLVLLTTCSAFDEHNIVEIVTALKLYVQSSCVYFLRDREFATIADLQQHEWSKKLMHLLSMKRTPSAALLTSVFPKIHNGVHFEQQMPVFAFPKTQQLPITALSELPTNGNMSNFVWLLFLDPDFHLDNYFIDLNIPFDCEFLVAQSHDDAFVITEVYRVSAALQLEVNDFGNWTPGGGLSYPKIGFHQRRNNLHGFFLRTGFQKSSAPIESSNAYEERGPTGILGEIWKILEEEMNFTTEYHFPTDNTIGGRSPNGSWTGIFVMLQKREVEVSNVVFSMMADRFDVMDFTAPTVDIKTLVLIRTPRTIEVKWNALLLSFTWKLWTAIACVVLVLSISVPLVCNLGHRHAHTEDLDYSLTRATFIVLGAFCQKGDSDTPKSASLRMLFLTIYLTVVILFACYSAAFITDLTLQDSALPFTTFEEFLQDGTYQLGMMPQSANMDYFKHSRVGLLKEIYEKLILPHEFSLDRSDVLGLQRLCYMRKYAHVTSTYNLMKKGYLPNCSITPIPQAFFPGTVALTMAKNSPYKRLFNYKLQTMRRVGILRGVYSRFPVDFRHNGEATKSSVVLLEIVPHFVILTAGIAISLLILVVEMYGGRKVSSELDNNAMNTCREVWK